MIKVPRYLCGAFIITPKKTFCGKNSLFQLYIKFINLIIVIINGVNLLKSVSISFCLKNWNFEKKLFFSTNFQLFHIFENFPQY